MRLMRTTPSLVKLTGGKGFSLGFDNYSPLKL
jgi:hypothetical protein